jgi:putative endopeptidase
MKTRKNKEGRGEPPIPPLRTNIKPGEDFYMHVNANWLRQVNMPSYSSAYGVSEEIEDRVRGALMKSIHDLMRQEPKHPLSLLAHSVLHTASQPNNVRDVRHLLHSLNCLRDGKDVSSEIGRLNRLQLRAPLTFTIAPDTFKSSECRVHIYEPVLGLPAKHHYTQGKRNRVIMRYANLLKKAGELLEVEELESVIALERNIIPFLSEGDSLRDPTESYIPKGIEELEKEYPNIGWSPMFLAWGMTEEQIRKSIFIVTNPRYIHELNRVFDQFDMASWRVWLRASAVLSLIEFLPPPFDDLHYELFGKLLRGNSEKMPQKFLMLRVLQTFAGQTLGRLFVAEHVPKSIKQEAETMVSRLRKATLNRIEGISWMLPKTKATAIQKVKHMRFQVAYPTVWENEFAGIQMDGERLIHNILALSSKDTIRMIKELGNECGNYDGKWDDGAFDVNAYYYPDRNLLTIPAGMLRPPFFDLKKSAAWNYGGIGSAIGHEITHGFDEDGKNYDIHGSYKDWWTSANNSSYQKMTQALIELYDGQEYAGGKVNGTLTLSENIADLGGVSIALDALHAYLKEKHASEKEKVKAYRDFFLSYAISWRNKDRPEKAKQSLYLDVHAPPPLRVNLIVRQFSEFYQAFGITEKDPGWIPKEERIQLW